MNGSVLMQERGGARGAVLPDYLGDKLRVVFCGTAASTASARRDHYYAGPGNELWPVLLRAGLVNEPLMWRDDSRVLQFGIGLTDLAKRVASSSDVGLDSHYDVARFIQKMATYSPRWVAFHGKSASRVVASYLGFGADVRLGKQHWRVAGRPVFVVPSMSGSNRSTNHLDGLPTRLAWFEALRDVLASEP